MTLNPRLIIRPLLIGGLCGISLTLVEAGNFIRFTQGFIGSIIIWTCLVIFNRATSKQNSPEYQNRITWQWPIVLIVVSLFIKTAMDLLSVQSSGDNFQIYIVIATDLAAVMSILLAFHYGGRPDSNYKLLAVAMVFATYNIVNVIAYKMGLSGIHGEETISADSIVRGDSSRMIAPFARGVNNFGNAAAAGVCLSIIILGATIRAKDYIGALISFGIISVCLSATILSEIRSVVIGTVLATIWSLPLGTWFRRLYLPTLTLAFLGFALIYPVLALNTTFATFIVNSVPESFERFSGDTLLLGGRIYIWEFGAFQLFEGEIPVLGLGISQRDASPAFAAGVGSGSGKMTMHNSALDILTVYGPIFGCFILASIFAICIWMSRNIFKESRETRYCLLYVGCIITAMACSFFEAFNADGKFWALLIVGISGFIQLKETHRAVASAKARE